MKNLLFLHGALGDAAQFSSLKMELENSFPIYAINFPGHGGEPFGTNFSINGFALETLRFLDENGMAQVDIFGYSMGGYVALQLARIAPERVGSIMALATKFAWSPESAARESKMLDPEKIMAKVPAFAQSLAGRHAPNDWKVLLQKTADLMLELGKRKLLDEKALAEIRQPVLVCRGELDQMVSQEESEWAAAALPKGQLHIFPETPHPFEKVATEKMAETIRRFFWQ
jgi:pimeloyl-ACP methyl ester carboxylesterase